MADIDDYGDAIRLIAALKDASLEKMAFQLESAFFGRTRLEVQSQLQSSLKEILAASNLPERLHAQALALYDRIGGYTA